MYATLSQTREVSLEAQDFAMANAAVELVHLADPGSALVLQEQVAHRIARSSVARSVRSMAVHLL